MRKIAVITGNRAEYGLLKNVIKEINKSSLLELKLIVTGTHLENEYGYTVKEIEEYEFNISEKIPIIMNSSNSENITKAMGLLILSLSQTFSRINPDMVLILGDRYEIFATALAATGMNIPLAHIAGGEITEGAMDEQLRHAITKLAHIHFTETEEYSNNVINMGEEKWRVFNVGSLGIENIKNNSFLNSAELYRSLNVHIDKNTILMTFHPVTLELKQLKDQVNNIVNVIKRITDKNIIITYPNSDEGSDYIIESFKKLEKENDHVHLFKSLGVHKYLSVMKLCGCVIGNSSSAIVESPYLKIPAVNIGNRQKGRLMATNIITCSYDSEDIYSAISQAFSNEFIIKVQETESLYGEGNTSKEIVKILENIEIDETLLKKKLVWS